jgi:hypothetical protein
MHPKNFPKSDRPTRRHFLGSTVAAGLAPSLLGTSATGSERADPTKSNRSRAGLSRNLVVNDDGYVFLSLNDNRNEAELQRYLAAYCRDGVGGIAYCVGDMSWPTLHPTQVGVHYSAARSREMARIYRNVDNFAALPGGYFGAVFRIIHGLGKKVIARFRMNDAHFTSVDNPNVSEFWKQHSKLTLGSEFGYYGGGLNYAHDEIRSHFMARVTEFVELYPEVDGVELDAMRSPFFFPVNKGPEYAPLMTTLIRDLKAFLNAQAKRLNRPDYLLTANVPLTPELALECGLDAATWDREGLLDFIAAGPYQPFMGHRIESWKKVLEQRTPIFAYINAFREVEQQRAAAANAYASGANGVYLFNYPCLLELCAQIPRRLDDPGVEPSGRFGFGLFGLKSIESIDLATSPQALDEIADPDVIRHKNKRFQFYFYNDTGYRHNSPEAVSFDRSQKDGSLKAPFRCFEDYGLAKKIVLRFKVEPVARSEKFEVSLNGRQIRPEDQTILYASNGRDIRIHPVTLGPYFEYEIPLKSEQLAKGDNELEIKPVQLVHDTIGTVRLVELELRVQYEW